jgi:hypothetical protein
VLEVARPSRLGHGASPPELLELERALIVRASRTNAAITLSNRSQYLVLAAVHRHLAVGPPGWSRYVSYSSQKRLWNGNFAVRYRTPE